MSGPPKLSAAANAGAALRANSSNVIPGIGEVPPNLRQLASQLAGAIAASRAAPKPTEALVAGVERAEAALRQGVLALAKSKMAEINGLTVEIDGLEAKLKANARKTFHGPEADRLQGELNATRATLDERIRQISRQVKPL